MKIVVFPAMIPETFGKKIHFLFSVRQVEDILREISVSPVPFSPGFVKGITRWRDHIVPVLSLEECLGFETADADVPNRLILVRGRRQEYAKEERAVIKTFGTFRIITLPIACKPAASLDWIPKPHLIKGLYEWEDGYLLCVSMDDILNGTFA